MTTADDQDDQKSRFERARELFDQAWSLHPNKRDVFVRTRAGDDEELAKEVMQLLERAGEAKTNELRARAEPEMDPSEPPEEGVRRIGPYRILSTLGEGGMGTVYLAEQRQPMRRRVALKVLKQGMDSKAFLARFEAERQALAMMEHSCIARVYDAGVTETGQPYLAMEHVKGVPITTYCDDNKLSIEARVELFLSVCSAIQHAHTKGVMHRDLKPSNILVTVQDGQPEPKVIDFGLAKAVDHRLVEATVFTEAGQVIGTPEYMSPEQAGVGGLDIDTRTDVFSLGVLLYQLLTGALPVTREELLKHGYFEMQRVIREEEMPKPSTKVTTLGDGAEAYAKARRLPLGQLQKQLRGELDWIVMKSIEKDRGRRYTTVHEMAADLMRHQRDEPVSAGPPSAGYLLRKMARKYRGPVLAGAGMVVALGVGLGVALWQWGVAEEKRVEAEFLKDELGGLLKVSKYQKMVVDVRRLEREGESLPPEGPGAVARYEEWLRKLQQWKQDQPDLRRALVTLRARGVDKDGEWYFDDEDEQFVHDALEELTAGIDRVAGDAAVQRAEQGLEWSRRLKRETVDERLGQWRDVADTLSQQPGFAGFDLRPQLGLVPIGIDGRSKLHEFWMPRTGDRPTRMANGQLELTPTTGVVLVLLPGGTFRMGSDTGALVYPNEMPAHDVELAPFFLGKFELTQGQWERLGGDNNSRYQSPKSKWHPIESVSWHEATALLRRVGLVLPTEAQWEYGCRAGTKGHWSFGDDRASLMLEGRGRLNAASKNIPDAALWPEFDDGHAVHTGTGSFEANPFGLHDMHGNIAEFTRGPTTRDYLGIRHRPGDGLILDEETDRAVQRGGSFWKRVEDARSACRTLVAKDAKYDSVGLRVARAVDE